MNTFRYIVTFTNGKITAVWAKNLRDAEFEASEIADEFGLEVKSVKIAPIAD